MRRYQLTRPEGIDHLDLVEAPAPRPARGQALVRVRAAALNYRDILVAEGSALYGRAAAPGLTPLADAAGEVVELGDGVAQVKLGDRVVLNFMRKWFGGPFDPVFVAGGLRGATADGVLAELVAVDADELVRIPTDLAFAEAASLPCAGVTAWNALYGERPLLPGQTVLALGTGGVSIFGIQIARAAGARAIITSSSDEKLARASELGASEGINYRRHERWEEEVLRLTDGRGVDHVLENGGAGTLSRSLQATRIGGSVHLIGVLTQGTVDPDLIRGRRAVVRGIAVGSRDDLTALVRAIAAGGFRPAVDKTFPFDEARQAYRYLQAQKHVGKVVIAVG
jgi:NADPH:quinone reductase-like Zn-dependent oxidoreductase